MDTLLGDRPAPLDPAASLTTLSTIRMAGIGDITVIARITQEGPPRTDLDPELIARATRLLLTHVAFARGAIWVEIGPDGVIARAVAVVPGTDMSPWHALGRVVGPDLATIAPMSPQDAVVGRALQAELFAAAPSWVMSEISRTPVQSGGRVALLAAAVDWARGQCVDAPGAIALVADSEAEAEAAQALGFEELHASDSHPGWWLGVVPQNHTALPSAG